MRISKISIVLLALLFLSRASANSQERPMLRAVNAGNPLELRKAIKKGADVNAKNRLGQPVIVIAAEVGDPEIVVALLTEGVEVDATDNSGKTALMVAAEQGHVDLAQLLLTADADFEAKDLSGLSATDYSDKNGYRDLSRLITVYKEDVDSRELMCEYLRLTADDISGEQELVLPVGQGRAKELLVDSMMAYGFVLRKDHGSEIVGRRDFPQFAMNWGTKNNYPGEKLFVTFQEAELGETRLTARTWSPPVGRKKRQWATAVLGHAECLFNLLDAEELASASLLEDREIAVPEGTPVRLRLRRHLTSKNVEVGQTIEFQVASNVFVDGHVAIEKGTPALGQVIDAKRGRGFNRAGILKFDIKSVTSVTGRRISLRSATGSYKGRRHSDGQMAMSFLSGGVAGIWLTKGEDVMLRAGTECSAFVAQDHEISSES